MVKQMVEINTFCQRVLNKNFPSIPVHADIKTYSAPDNVFDLVFGGFPCQDVSIAGKQLGVINGKRSSLFYELLRVFKESGATFLVLENVLGLLRNGFREVLRSLSESGYDAEWQTISAAALGAPHLRERIFLIAYPSSLQFSKKPSPWSDQIRCQAAIASTYPNSASSQRDRSAKRSPQKRTESLPSTGLNAWSNVSAPICGVDARLPNRLNRLAALGNAIVPQCAAIALMRVQYLAECAAKP